MKILVAYYTKSGASETYARTVADTLGENGFDVNLVNLKTTKPDVSDYDVIIAGTGVRMFMVYGKWKKVLRQKGIGTKKLALFLSSGTAIDKPREAIGKWVNPLVEKYRLKPIAIGSFPGTMPDKFKEEKDRGKETMKPELAREWAIEIAAKLKEAKT